MTCGALCIACGCVIVILVSWFIAHFGDEQIRYLCNRTCNSVQFAISWAFDILSTSLCCQIKWSFRFSLICQWEPTFFQAFLLKIANLTIGTYVRKWTSHRGKKHGREKSCVTILRRNLIFFSPIKIYDLLTTLQLWPALHLGVSGLFFCIPKSRYFALSVSCCFIFQPVYDFRQEFCSFCPAS